MSTPLPSKSFSFKFFEKVYYVRPVEGGEGHIVTDTPNGNFGEWVDCWEGMLGFLPFVPGKTVEEKIKYVRESDEFKEYDFNRQMKDITND
jgi:hypothetical protein